MILTDSPEFANTFLNANFTYFKADNKSPYRIFFDKDFYYSDNNLFNNEHFSDVIINKFSYTSQFDILNQINFTGNIICFSDSGNDFHGFKSRKWETLSGNFHIAFKIKPETNFKFIYQSLIIFSANIVISSIKELTSLQPKIKWVNDIMLNDAKVAGFITKTKSQLNKISEAIIGIGVNIEKSPDLIPDKFIKKATHLNKYNNNISSSEFFYTFLKFFDFYYKLILNKKYSILFNKYVDDSLIIDKNIKIYDENNLDNLLVEGIVKSIEKDLSIKFKNTAVKFNKGRISMQDFF